MSIRELVHHARDYVRLVARGAPPQSLILPTVQRIAPGLFSCGCGHPKDAHGLSCAEVLCSMCPPASADSRVYTTRVSRVIVGSHR